MRTVHLGQFTDENAERVAAALEEAEIVWWHKRHGSVVRWLSAADWGVRIYVEADRLDAARRLVRDLLGDDVLD